MALVSMTEFMTTMGHIQGANRYEEIEFPQRFGAYITADNPVRFIDASSMSLTLKCGAFATRWRRPLGARAIIRTTCSSSTLTPICTADGRAGAWIRALEGFVPCYRLTRTFQIRLQNLPIITKKRESWQVGSELFHVTHEHPRLRRSSHAGVNTREIFPLSLMHFKVDNGTRPA
jgi:hypothetical protein